MSCREAGSCVVSRCEGWRRSLNLVFHRFDDDQDFVGRVGFDGDWGQVRFGVGPVLFVDQIAVVVFDANDLIIDQRDCGELLNGHNVIAFNRAIIWFEGCNGEGSVPLDLTAGVELSLAVEEFDGAKHNGRPVGKLDFAFDFVRPFSAATGQEHHAEPQTEKCNRCFGSNPFHIAIVLEFRHVNNVAVHAITK